MGAFLKRLGATEDIFFCNDKANCTCMNGCGQYSGRLRPGDRSVKLSNIKKEDADVEFLFHFENDPGKQAPKSCIFKIDPEFCSGKLT